MASPTQQDRSDSKSQMPDITGQIVSVLAGKRIFYVHESLLTGSSKFFQNAMKPEWRTDSTNPIDLSDSLEDWINYVASLYVFGERVMDGLFQDAIISALIDHCTRTNKMVSLSLVRIIYQGTTSSSPARRLMVDVCEFDSGPKANKLQFLEVDKDGEFMLDLIVAMAKHRKPACGVSGYPWVKEPHSYLLGAAQELQATVDKTQSGDFMDTTDV